MISVRRPMRTISMRFPFASFQRLVSPRPLTFFAVGNVTASGVKASAGAAVIMAVVFMRWRYTTHASDANRQLGLSYLSCLSHLSIRRLVTTRIIVLLLKPRFGTRFFRPFHASHRSRTRSQN